MTASGFRPDPDGLRRALALLLERTLGDGELPPRPPDAQLPADLPADGIGEHAALDALAPLVLDSAAPLRHPGYVAHMDPPTPWVTWAAAQWSAALNQNLLHLDTAPIARELERHVVGWLAPLFGMDGGHLLPGSSVANITALWAARELRGIRTVVASSAAHLSLRKAANLLGLDYRSIPADDRQRLPLANLGDLSRAALVLTAGTVATGAIDPLGARHGAAWLHVDAAWSGPLRFSAEHSPLLDGIERADSVSVSAHKWLWQPKESAMILFAASDAAHEALSFGGGYLAVPNVGLLGSHGQVALPLAATLLSWGRSGVAERIEQCMRRAEELAALVREDARWELHSAPTTGIVVWRPRGVAAADVRARMKGAFASLTQLDGETWLRSVCVNPASDGKRVLAVARAALDGSRAAASDRPHHRQGGGGR